MLKIPTCVPLSHHCRVIYSFLGKATFAVLGHGAILCVFIMSLCLTPGLAQARMSQLSDEVLRGISGQSGMSIVLDGAIQIHFDLLKFSDTQTTPNWIELYNVNVDNGAGGPFSFATLGADVDNPSVFQPNTIDVWTDSSGVTRVQMVDTSHMNPRWYSVGSLVLNAYDIKDYSAPLATAVTTYLASNPDPGLSAAYFANPSNPSLWDSNDFLILDALNDINIDPLIVKYQASVNHTNTSQSLGSINLDALRQGPSVYRLWAHAASGISFDYTTAISASALTYTYNTAPTALSLTGIHIVGSATGGSDDPANPATWVFGGTSNFFKIGTIGDASNTPATVDVGTEGTETSISLNLPMAGTVRVENVTFGGQSFGPIAIDGIQVHRLNVKISP